MPRNFNLNWKGASIKDPRVVMRAVIGVLLAANLVAAVIAFKPFGGSADDLRREQESLRAQVTRLQANLATSKRMADKVQVARTQGDQFLTKYIVDGAAMASTLQAELNRLATDAGIKAGPASISEDPIEGSDTLGMLTISAGFEGSYANLTKLVNLLDKSPRFLIIDSMQAAAPQGQGDKILTVTLKILTFVRTAPGAAA